MSYTVTCPSCREKNPGNLLICSKCQTSLVGLPREEYPPFHPKSLVQEIPSLSNSLKPAEENLMAWLFLLLAKTFGIACLVGMIVSIVGWQSLHWHSSRQFSDGLFWTGAASAVVAFFAYRGELHGRETMLTAFYVQPSGTLSMQERAKRWMADAASNYRVFFYFFLITLYLIGFSALIWSLF